MQIIIGRHAEKTKLNRLLSLPGSQFVAVYGRRRVGKTFLIRSFFKNNFTFQVTAMANANMQQQLINFYYALNDTAGGHDLPVPKSWIETFRYLKALVEKSKTKKKIIFIDELPWFDSAKSKFIQSLEHFWNSFASARNDVILIVCGSAASWMLNKVINSKGGLHNRVTQRIKLAPFSILECKELLKAKKINLDDYQIARLYMAFGGIPFYWNEVEKGLSADQNIQNLCFMQDGFLYDEFNNLFPSLFTNYEQHLKIVLALAKISKGLERRDIIQKTGLPDAGSTTRILEELEQSDFIRKYKPFGKQKRQSLYQLIDFYTLFYLKFIRGNKITSENYWINSFSSPKYRTWSGYAFELLCLLHINQIKRALGISGIETAVYSWKSRNIQDGAQIDLVIDRKDQLINICEMKFSINEFTIDKSYAGILRNKIARFKEETKTRKTIIVTMVTTFGLKVNQQATGLVQSDITLADLFA